MTPRGRGRRIRPLGGLAAPGRTLPATLLPAVSQPPPFPIAFPFSFRFASRGRPTGVVRPGCWSPPAARGVGQRPQVPAGKAVQGSVRITLLCVPALDRGADAGPGLVTGDRDGWSPVTATPAGCFGAQPLGQLIGQVHHHHHCV